MRLGIFGGSFDPVHRGHLALATCCQQQASLDQIWFTPTAVQPLKQDGPQASNGDREAMLQLAISDHPHWQLCQYETQRGGVSYSVDTLRTIHAQYPQANCFLLMGADTLHWFPSWKQPREVCQLATPLVVHRAGERDPDFSRLAPWVSNDQLQKIIDSQVQMPPLAISSSLIRQQAASGNCLEDLVPASVANYIVEHRLYRTDSVS